MGIIGLEKAEHLYWLGRYTGRVFETLKTFFKYYDIMIEENPEYYKEFCERLSIPDVYNSKETFVKEYLFNSNITDSVYANLLRAYHNAVVMRNDLSSESLAYIEMAVNWFEKEKESETPVASLQPIIDIIYAFWGSMNDYIESEECRHIIRCGKYIERLDLHMRLNIGEFEIEKEFQKLKEELGKVEIAYDKDRFNEFEQLCKDWNYKVKDTGRAIQLLESII